MPAPATSVAETSPSPSARPTRTPFRGGSGETLSVIVPVFNDATQIAANLELLISEVEPYFPDYEVLVVSDGSTDGTVDVLAGLRHPRLKVIAYPQNKGKGYAVREGMKAARGTYVFMIDGGMELHPTECKIFVGLMELYGADMVIGSKRHPQSQVIYPRLRRMLSFCYQKLVKRLFGLNVTDTQVGMKLFRREVVQAVLPDLTIDRYGFDLELLALARRRGYKRVLEAPIRLDYFHSNFRPVARELLHVFKVGASVLADTLRLYRRIRRLEAQETPHPVDSSRDKDGPNDVSTAA